MSVDEAARHGLGRLHAPDQRDERFLMAEVAPRRSARTYRYWYTGAWLDQGATPRCVAYSWAHYLADGPLTMRPSELPDTAELYHRAQRLDEWPGEAYDGTSVRAGAKVLTELGLVAEYRWAWDAETVARTVLDVGPVVVGTTWLEGMSRAPGGFLELDGDVVGGHAYLLSGVHTGRRVFRVRNSWGRGWGDRGRAWLRFEDLDELLRDRGEACLAVESRRSVLPS